MASAESAPVRLEDVWSGIDRPTLVGIAEVLGRHRPPVTSDEVVASTGLEHRDVVEAGFRLARRYVEASDLSTNDGPDWAALGLTEAGLREVGLWPDEASALDRLQAALHQAADAAAPADRPKIVAVLEAVGGMGRDLAVNVVGAIITGRIQPS